MRRNVTLAPRVGVRAPGSTDAVGPFEHHEVIDPCRLEPDRGPEPREARADDHDAVVGAHACRTVASGLRGSSSKAAASSS